MKPIPQVSHRQNAGFPLTDYNYQTTTDGKSSCAAVLPQKKLRAPWKLSAEFFGSEAHLYYAVELVCFTAIGVISAWPIISMLHAITRMVRNY
jgi:hypothetical protein